MIFYQIFYNNVTILLFFLIFLLFFFKSNNSKVHLIFYVSLYIERDSSYSVHSILWGFEFHAILLKNNNIVRYPLPEIISRFYLCNLSENLTKHSLLVCKVFFSIIFFIFIHQTQPRYFIEEIQTQLYLY